MTVGDLLDFLQAHNVPRSALLFIGPPDEELGTDEAEYRVGTAHEPEVIIR